MPEPFLIGVATSGYQFEGGYNGICQPRNNWADCEASGRVARTGIAVDFWNRYRDDFALTRSLGLNSFRLSIEWSRVQPSTSKGATHAPAFDFDAIDAYATRIAACREEGLEPVVTLHHFTHPDWLGVNAWLQEPTVEAFETFVKTTVTRVNDQLADIHDQPPISWYVTINEPNMLVLNTYLNRLFPGGPEIGIAVGIQAYSCLLAAHVRAYNVIHDIYDSKGWGTPRVSMNTFCSDVYWSEMMLLDLLCMRKNGTPPSDCEGLFEARASELSAHFTKLALNRRTDLAAIAGAGLHKVANYFASRAANAEGFRFFFEEAARAKRPQCLDYLGLDYYDPFASHALRVPDFSDLEIRSHSISEHILDGLASKWWDWHFLPEGLEAFCSYYTRAFPGLGILIAENGMAHRCLIDNSLSVSRHDELLRSDYIEAHLRQVRHMLDRGVPLLGYMHWALTDNYEWGSYTPRFGLFRIDFQKDLTRLPVDQFGDNPSETYARLVQEWGLAKCTIHM